MTNSANDVVISGIGIVSCHGVGKDAHIAILSADQAPEPVVDTDRFTPYPVHPLPEIDWSEQIPRRGDQRQMENWQRLGVFTAGLALDDAGLKDDADACGAMDMIVAAGGGERDIEVDTLIVNEAAHRNDRAVLLNEKLTTELRPTLFLAQLSNLLAGNISIVHKVTGSSKTFMGEEGAGISAVHTAYERIRAGQTEQALVGGSYNAERPDMHVLFEGVQGLSRINWQPLWSRDEPGGIITGSASAFLVMESRRSAEKRDAPIYATISAVEGDRGSRDGDGLERRLSGLAERVGPDDDTDLLIMSGSSGIHEISRREKDFIDGKWPSAVLRGYSGLTGHALETQFPLGIALSALALKSGSKIPPFDRANEGAMTTPASRALVTALGFVYGEGLAVLESEQP
ncbi:MAG: beta-ketoacyl-ACP synthase [Alphaproteobacteria bacterium]|nr:beta-ketoacyl-ACP synthase [Alphaproteobacteria bacterium]